MGEFLFGTHCVKTALMAAIIRERAAASLRKGRRGGTQLEVEGGRDATGGERQQEQSTEPTPLASSSSSLEEQEQETHQEKGEEAVIMSGGRESVGVLLVGMEELELEQALQLLRDGSSSFRAKRAKA